ncbi:hypothetical protein [Streptomyces luteireticuli]|uniref:hypothetical protein n=1 Tax=Streptomyces luteireticuli TaxID=173858 RepID=UPI0031CE57C0
MSGRLPVEAAARAYGVSPTVVRDHLGARGWDDDAPGCALITPLNVASLALEALVEVREVVRETEAPALRLEALKVLGDFVRLADETARSAEEWVSLQEQRARAADRVKPEVVDIWDSEPPSWCERGSPGWQRWYDNGVRRVAAENLLMLGVNGGRGLSPSEARQVLAVEDEVRRLLGADEFNGDPVVELAGSLAMRQEAVSVLGERAQETHPLLTVDGAPHEYLLDHVQDVHGVAEGAAAELLRRAIAGLKGTRWYPNPECRS